MFCFRQVPKTQINVAEFRPWLFQFWIILHGCHFIYSFPVKWFRCPILAKLVIAVSQVDSHLICIQVLSDASLSLKGKCSLKTAGCFSPLVIVFAKMSEICNPGNDCQRTVSLPVLD